MHGSFELKPSQEPHVASKFYSIKCTSYYQFLYYRELTHASRVTGCSSDMKSLSQMVFMHAVHCDCEANT